MNAVPGERGPKHLQNCENGGNDEELVSDFYG